MYIEISLKKLKAYLDEMNRAYNKLRSEKYELIQVRSILKLSDDSAMKQVVEKLARQIEGMDESIRNLSKIIAGLEKIIKLYAQTEEAVADYEPEIEQYVGGLHNWTPTSILVNKKFVNMDLIGKIVID